MSDSRFTVLNRSDIIAGCVDKEFDLIIIGGGVTGCGIALDAASRGLKALLIEKTDFSAGTSSKSTKLIHGGLRYLKQLEIGLVRETGTERAIVHKIAPHLVHPERMLLPIVHGGTFNKWTASLAITVYDWLAGVAPEDRKETLNYQQTIEKEPLLDPSLIKSGIVYAEYRTDDSRLTIELAKKAAQLGSVVINHCEVTRFEYNDVSICGVRCHDHIVDCDVSFFGKVVVSAAGPWVDKLRAKDNLSEEKSLRLTKGVHIVVSRDRFALKQAVYFDAFDGRMIFAIPRGKATYIGTSDTDYTGNLDEVLCTTEDVDYLIAATNRIFPKVALDGKKDVISSWAGLRPLVFKRGKPSEISRRDEIFTSPSGLISIAGGKLTGYRKMAQRVVYQVYKKLGTKSRACVTKKLSLTDNPFVDYSEVKTQILALEPSLGVELAWYLTTTYGKKAIDIVAKSKSTKSIDIVEQEVIYTIEHEAAANPIDFLTRRTGRTYFDITDAEAIIEKVMDTFGQYMSWSIETRTLWRSKIDTELEQARIH
jgi:glycerol-3-phosphate dehydrogenase